MGFFEQHREMAGFSGLLDRRLLGQVARDRRQNDLSPEKRELKQPQIPNRSLPSAVRDHSINFHGKGMAEGEGFEPPLPVKAKRFSRPPVSTTHTSLRGVSLGLRIAGS